MKVVVVGIANQQTALPIGSFPLEYEAQRYLPNEIRHTVGGVGFNVARTLSAFGHMVALAAPLGEDYSAAMVDAEAYSYAISTHLCPRELARTPRSVVLYDETGRRLTNVDLTDALDFVFSEDDLAPDLFKAKLVVLGNVGMTIPLIAPIVARGTRLAVDLQDIRSPEDPAAEPFLAATYLSMSNEYVKGQEREVLTSLRDRSEAKVISVTLGAEGALVLPRDAAEPIHVPAPRVTPRNTAGAGDVAFATFLHAHLKLKEGPVEAWQRAVQVASSYVALQALHGSFTPEQFHQNLGSNAVPEALGVAAPWNEFTAD